MLWCNSIQLNTFEQIIQNIPDKSRNICRFACLLKMETIGMPLHVYQISACIEIDIYLIFKLGKMVGEAPWLTKNIELYEY